MGKLNPTLAKRAARAASSKLTRTVAQARADVALVRLKKEVIADAFYEIGEALLRLKAPAVYRALGHESFASLCQKEVEISVEQAHRLIDIVQRMDRKEATELGSSRAAAILELVDATHARDTPRGLERHGVTLPSGERLDVKRAPLGKLRAAAREVRTATPSKSKRGKHLDAADAAFGTRLQTALAKHGAKAAKVTVVAGLPGKGARLRIEGVEIAHARAVQRALGDTLAK
jgi:hypothetical protein